MLNESNDNTLELDDDTFTSSKTVSSSHQQTIKEPFLKPVHGDEYFSGGHWGQCLDLMAHLCQFSEHVLVLTGEHGVGKSTLKHALLRKSESQFRLLTLSAEASWDIATLMRRIAQGFGLEWDEGRGTDIWQAPGREVEHESPFSQTWVLLLDNADNLSDELIQALLSLSREGVGVERQLHLLFVGKPPLAKRLLASPFKEQNEDRIHTISLEPLTLSETEAYLTHKWRIAGFKKPLPFTAAQIKHIYQLTNGIPLAIDKLAKAHLNGETIPEAAAVTSWGKALSPATIAIATLSSILLLGLTVLPAVLEEGKESKQAQVQSSMANSPASKPIKPVTNTSKSVENRQVKTLSLPLERSFVEKTKEEKIAQLKALTQELASERKKKETHKGKAIPEDKVEKVINKQPAVVIIKKEPEKKNIELGSDFNEKPKAAEKIKVRSNHEKMSSAETKTTAAKTITKNEAISEVKTKPQVVSKNVPKVTKPKPKGPHYSKEEREVLNQKGSRWTLQLIGLTDKERVTPFIKKNRLADSAMTYPSSFKGKPWTVIIYGNYASKDEASKAINRLPRHIRDLKPWPRPYSSIQKEIREKHQS